VSRPSMNSHLDKGEEDREGTHAYCFWEQSDTVQKENLRVDRKRAGRRELCEAKINWRGETLTLIRTAQNIGKNVAGSVGHGLSEAGGMEATYYGTSSWKEEGKMLKKYPKIGIRNKKKGPEGAGQTRIFQGVRK